MVEIFKTDVQTASQAKQIVHLLNEQLTNARVNFDLHDCDKILRVEGITCADLQGIINQVNRSGFVCEIIN